MKRNPIMPFVVIMVIGVLAMFLISFKGIGDSKDLAAELEGGGKEQTEQATATPEEIYQKSCIGCHGEQYEGASAPALTGVGDRLSKEEIEDVVVNGRTGEKGVMPGGLVPAEKASDMADWLSGL
ncbi:cytochrome c [Bacillus sp. V3B]|uniref:cytochrome c550 n=1 Tax=Bacillus sp. V3B TaxID=2804915 RepID=UPI0021089CCA|nr:cytochrome c [Bacillus sp. V3B]MCQ6273652.1 cytochrome c [Bacillus sp. V3B]